jgi:hypothetical protein
VYTLEVTYYPQYTCSLIHNLSSYGIRTIMGMLFLFLLLLFMLMVWDYVFWTVATSRLLFIYWMIIWVWRAMAEWDWQGKTEGLREKLVTVTTAWAMAWHINSFEVLVYYIVLLSNLCEICVDKCAASQNTFGNNLLMMKYCFIAWKE